MMPTQASIPNWTVQTLRTGSFNGPPERRGDDQVREGEPISAVGDERVTAPGLGQALMHPHDPADETGHRPADRRQHPRQVPRLDLQREGCHAADDQAEDHHSQPQPDPT
jgi:hypothetical protein